MLLLSGEFACRGEGSVERRLAARARAHEMAEATSPARGEVELRAFWVCVRARASDLLMGVRQAA